MRGWSGWSTNTPNRSIGPRPLYRLGRILTARGQGEAGLRHLINAADTAPESFYSLRARELTGQPQTTPPGPFETQQAITPDEQEQWRAWLVEQRDLDLAEQERQRARVAAEPRFRRAFALLAAGFTSAGEEELRDLADAVADEPAALVHVATTAHTEGHTRIAMRLGEQAFHDMEGARVLEVPRVLQKLIYPLGFVGLVEPESRQRALDPLLLTALIRKESVFDPRRDFLCGRPRPDPVYSRHGAGRGRSARPHGIPAGRPLSPRRGRQVRRALSRRPAHTLR